MHSTLMIFIDGVGLGKKDPAVNPFFRYPFRSFNEIFGLTPSLGVQCLRSGDLYLFPADATLGVPGLPQSGTGQTSIFCGINAPELLGQHFGPYPHSALIPALKEKNIFREFLNLNETVCFANAYPKIFFDYIRSGKTRLSATSLCCRLSGVRLNKYTDLKKGRALSAEINNFRWVTKLNYNRLPVIKPETAARRLLRLAENHTFTLFEYFLTDHLGHGRLPGEMEVILKCLDDFLYYILRNFNRQKINLVICSDHGNLEDISVKGHTLNPALTITGGVNSKVLSESIKNLTDIKPAILRQYR